MKRVSPLAVQDVTGHPEILGGRVKTLHPRIHGALLARYELEDHRRQLEEQDITPIHVVVVNLYPFASTIAKEGVTVAEAIEQIDIGGPTMVRATAKNFQNLTILTDPQDYQTFLEEIGDGPLPSLSFRLAMARKAFQHTFAYDQKIADYLDGVQTEEDALIHRRNGGLPETLRLNARRDQVLRYGENPHQEAAFYRFDDQQAQREVVQHQGNY